MLHWECNPCWVDSGYGYPQKCRTYWGGQSVLGNKLQEMKTGIRQSWEVDRGTKYWKGIMDIYFELVRHFLILTREKSCWTQNRIEKCYIFNLMCSSYQCYPGYVGCWTSNYGWVYTLWAVIDLIRHNCRVPLIFQSPGSPLRSKQARIACVFHFHAVFAQV